MDNDAYLIQQIVHHKAEVCGSLVFGAGCGTVSDTIWEVPALHFWQFNTNEITGNKQLNSKAIPEQINHHFSVFRT